MQKRATILVILFMFAILTVSSSYASNDHEYIMMAQLSMEEEYPEYAERNHEGDLSDSLQYYSLHNDSQVSLRNLYLKDDDSHPGNSAFRAFLHNGNAYDELFNEITYDFSMGNDVTTGFQVGMPSGVGDILTIGAAFLTNLTAHEFGHEIVAGHVGAKGSNLNFFKKQDGSFFLGTSTVESINEESALPYHMGGEVFADITFEHALKKYRENPTTYNKALLVFSGSDFLWYSLYSFYLSDGHSHFDPISIQEETGISKDALFSLAFAKTAVNAYRVYSGKDHVVPYFSVNNDSASLKVIMPF